MSDHYHVVAATGGTYAISTLTYENYEDAVEQFVHLTTFFFSGSIPEEDLAVENALEATADGHGAYVGTESLALYFMPCDDEPCMAPNWN